MNGQLDITKVHTKMVKSILDLKKQFNAVKKGGTCQKFQILFEDGYEAEYCPLIGRFDEGIKANHNLTFKIIHRGNFGDEIEPYFISQDAGTGNTPKQPRQAVANMHVHPATIALNAAIRFHAEVVKDNASIDVILSDADTIQDWLYDQVEQTTF
jgi:hypothetical protein